jgi:hypothetical protein
MPSRHTQDATHTLGVQAGRLRTHLHALDRTLDIDVHRISGAVVVDILDLDVVPKSLFNTILAQIWYCVSFPYSPKKTYMRQTYYVRKARKKKVRPCKILVPPPP